MYECATPSSLGLSSLGLVRLQLHLGLAGLPLLHAAIFTYQTALRLYPAGLHIGVPALRSEASSFKARSRLTSFGDSLYEMDPACPSPGHLIAAQKQGKDERSGVR